MATGRVRSAFPSDRWTLGLPRDTHTLSFGPQNQRPWTLTLNSRTALNCTQCDISERNYCIKKMK